MQAPRAARRAYRFASKPAMKPIPGSRAVELRVPRNDDADFYGRADPSVAGFCQAFQE